MSEASKIARLIFNKNYNVKGVCTMKLYSSFNSLFYTACFIFSLLPNTLFATNGYFPIGYGSNSRSMGGVGVAYPQDGYAAASNPASIIDVDKRFDITGEFFNPPLSVVHDSEQFPARERGERPSIAIDDDLYLIPGMGGVFFNNNKVALGFSMIGAGFGSEFDQSWDPVTRTHNGETFPSGYFFNFNGLGGDTLSVELLQMQVLPTIAYRINSNHTIGFSPALAVQGFRVKGLTAFGDTVGSSDPENLTDNNWEYTFGAGVRVGWLGNFLNNRLNIGINYASKVFMERFEDYRGLFANQGEFDIPEHYAIGFAFKATDKLTLALDVQEIKYSDVASIGNKGPLANDPATFYPCGSDECGRLGLNDGLGFGWDDQTVYKFGIDYKLNPKINLRAGYNYSESPIDEDQVLFNLIAPAVVEEHLTLGFSYKISEKSELSANYMRAFENTVKGPTAFPPQAGTIVVGSNAALKLEQNSFGLTYSYKFDTK